ncbi:hypothetical protein [Dyadobacter sp. CY356]|uniref:hypothetical protein n=1 Tax=Dyadobacter sp. CY356 TaxID=2906442 RepID=UPI001F373CA6|nr:hypothetical protein [Dyadobacter sp. CY356]MCF0055107.1 hypothetical protein [Dyadobacter sp. CY356]
MHFLDNYEVKQFSVRRASMIIHIKANHIKRQRSMLERLSALGAWYIDGNTKRLTATVAKGRFLN